ncbi:putative Zn-dependent peptidase [Lachnospiraceae bacterium PF1-21]
MNYGRTNKSYRLCVRVDEETYTILKDKAKSYDNMSDCLRSIMLADIPQKNKHVLESLLKLQYELRKIGVNVNQIAKDYNSQFYNEKDKKNLFMLLEKINELEKQIVNEVLGNP